MSLKPSTTAEDRHTTPVRLRRSIVLGLGGTGRTVCTHLKKILLERNDHDPERFPHVQILSIDTDNRLKTVDRRDGGLLRLDGNETLGLLLPPRDQSAFRAFAGDKTRTLLPEANEQGAMAHRPLGHAFLVTNWQRIREAVSHCTRRLAQADLGRLLRSDPRFAGLELDRRRIDVYVVGNLVSGTGSGTAVGMGYLLRSLFNELSHNDLQVSTEGIFTTCGVYNLADVQGSPGPYPVNCYAALLELAHFSDPTVHENPRRTWDPGFDDVRLEERDVRSAPYDRVQLLNPTHAAHGALTHEEFEPLIAEVLALRTGSRIGMEANAKLVEEVRNVADRDNFGNYQFCWAWGASTFRSAAQEILDLAVALVARDTVEALVGGLDASLDRAEIADRLTTALGLGYEPGRSGDMLLEDLLTPPEPTQDIPAGSHLLRALEAMVERKVPHVDDDPEAIRELPTLLDLELRQLEERFHAVLGELVPRNRRRLAVERWDMVRREIQEIAAAGRRPGSSLDGALAVLDLLLGDGSAPGRLQAESAVYQAQVGATISEATAGGGAAESALHSIRTICRGSRGFDVEALRGAREQLVGGLLRRYSAEAKQAAFREARILLDGDPGDRDETLRLGLARGLAQLRTQIQESRRGLESIVESLQGRADSLGRALDQQSPDGTSREAGVTLAREVSDDKLRPLVSEALADLGPPWRLGERWVELGAVERDRVALERRVRPRVELAGSHLQTQSIEEDPEFGGLLPYYLQRAEPAVGIDADAQSGDQLALVSPPDDVPGLHRRLLDDESRWLASRTGQRSPEERIVPRPGDHEPRVDVLTTCYQFSPAALVGIDDWGTRYERIAASEAGRRNVHTVPTPRSGRLVFEPLGTTEDRLLAACFVGRALAWIVTGDRGEAVYRYDIATDFGSAAEERPLEAGADDTEILTVLRKPLRPGSGDAKDRQPLFVHLLRRLDQNLRGPDRSHTVARLADGLACLFRADGPLVGALFPTRNDGRSFTRFVSALESALAAEDAYDEVRDETRRRVDGGPPHPRSAPSVAVVAVRSCPAGHANPPRASYCTTCGESLSPPDDRCPECDARTDPEARFCGVCGHHLSDETGAR